MASPPPPMPSFNGNGISIGFESSNEMSIEITGTSADTVASEIRGYFEKAVSNGKIVQACNDQGFGLILRAGNFSISEFDNVTPPRYIEVKSHIGKWPQWDISLVAGTTPHLHIILPQDDSQTLTQVMIAAGVSPTDTGWGEKAYRGQNIMCAAPSQHTAANCMIEMPITADVGGVQSIPSLPSPKDLNLSTPVPKCQFALPIPVAPPGI